MLAFVSINIALAAGSGAEILESVPADKRFDPLGKPPSERTLKAIAEDAAGLLAS